MTAIVLRLAALIALVLVATALAHWVRDSLEMTLTPENEMQIHRGIMIGMAAYVGFLAMPFVPGAEIGIALLTAFGAAIAPLIYVATVSAMMLAYILGRLLPVSALVWLLSALRLRRAAALFARAATLSRDERLALLMEGAPPKLLTIGLRHRYIALALAVNIPGNSLVGGGGGIMMMAGLTGLFAPMTTLLAVMIGVAPVPLAVWLMGL